jgi:predicted TIM-barrel fold metal-dependent hydrolase
VCAGGVAVIDDKTSDADLDAVGKAGVRGIRLNLATGGSNDPALARRRFVDAHSRIASHNWHIQIYTNLAIIAAIKDHLALASSVPVVLDHFGGAQVALRPTHPGFADLVELVRSGRACVKISGAYRALTQAPYYPDVAPARPSADRGKRRTHRVGHRLAASRFDNAAGRQGDRGHAPVSDRRRAADEPAPGLGT